MPTFATFASTAAIWEPMARGILFSIAARSFSPGHRREPVMEAALDAGAEDVSPTDEESRHHRTE